MLLLPAATGVTTPVIGLTVAMAVLAELQVPPAVPLLLYVTVCPVHTLGPPLIVPALASAVTVMFRVAVLVQPPEVTV
jgi:hypothetical protein